MGGDVRPKSTRIRRRIGKLLVACALAIAMTAGAATLGDSVISTPAASGQTDQPIRVAVIGDSLIATTASEQQEALTRRGYRATVAGNPGKPLTHPWIQEQLDQTGGVDIVVIATASNDNLQVARRADEVDLDRGREEYIMTVTRTLDRLAAPCTVLVDVRQQSAAVYRPDTATTTNAALRLAASAASRPTIVAPWSTQSSGHDHRDWFVSDELHFIESGQRQDAGIQAYAGAIADGVDQCGALLAL